MQAYYEARRNCQNLRRSVYLYVENTRVKINKSFFESIKKLHAKGCDCTAVLRTTRVVPCALLLFHSDYALFLLFVFFWKWESISGAGNNIFSSISTIRTDMAELPLKLSIKGLLLEARLLGLTKSA